MNTMGIDTLEELFSRPSDIVCDCGGDHSQETGDEQCPNPAAWRVSVRHTCTCGKGCETHQHLLLLCTPCLASWQQDPEGFQVAVLGKLR